MIKKSKEKRTTKSLKIKPSAWKKAKFNALTQDITLSEYIEKLIEKSSSD